MAKKRLLEAVSTLVGCVIGAGVLGIPYVIAQAGFITGLLNIIVLGAILLLIHLYLGEVVLRTKGNHQLPGYAEKYTGRIGKYLMFLTMVIGIYGSLIAYGIGGGESLAALLGWNPLVCGIIFFGILSCLVYIGLGAIEKSESLIIPLVVILVALVFILSLTKLNPANLTGFSPEKIFLPYGVVLFAFLGTAAIPEMKEELGRNNKLMKKALIIGGLIPIVLYILFSLAIVGSLGAETMEIGVLGLATVLGKSFAFIGPVFALLTVTTSFLALGLALKELFWYDYGLRHNTAWLLSCFVPFLLFLLLKLSGYASFTAVLNITGIISGAIIGIMTILMVLNAKKKGERKPEYSIYINKFIAVLLILVYVAGAIQLLL